MPANSTSKWSCRIIPVGVSMDPALVFRLCRERTGLRSAATASTAAGEIAVVARVDSPDHWEAISQVSPGVVMQPGTDGSCIVTGRVPESEMENVRKASGVRSLKAARPVRPALAATGTDTGLVTAAGAQLLSDAGKGCVVGIVDYGCDFMHQNFLTAAGKTRLLALWHQGGDFNNHAHRYGRLFPPAEINNALTTTLPYATLGYRPGEKSHGTHVMDIAAGNGRGSGVPGCAPAADLVFVHLAANDVPWSGPATVQDDVNFGNSAQLLEAVKFIFEIAGPRPCVVNLSLGTFGGSHDGTSLVEQGIDSEVLAAPGRAVVIAAGNSASTSAHLRATVAHGGTLDFTWQVPFSFARSSQELEIWYSGSDVLTAELIAPDGTSILTVDSGEQLMLEDGTNIVALVASRLHDPNNGDNQINLYLGPAADLGDYTVRLHGQVVTNGTLHAWVERNDQHQSRLSSPLVQEDSTLGSISCGRESIAVASYDAHKPALPRSFFSSRGPTRDGREKPEVAAPGHDVVAAASQTVSATRKDSGTSMAAPAIAGIAAALLAEARKRGLPLTSSELRKLICDGARPAVAGTAWEPSLGCGRASAARSLALLPLGHTPVAAAAVPARKPRTAGASKKPRAATAAAARKRPAKNDRPA